jgi:group I intron endonuclease
MYLYKITNIISGSIYIGITKVKINIRFNQHKCAAKRNIKNKLYSAMRKYGVKNFKIEILNTYSDINKLYKAEKNAIKSFKKSGYNLYNILDGGKSYFPIVNKTEWKRKLTEKRKGKKPALGMKHTKENKKLFSEISLNYWKENKKYKEEEIIKYGFTEANKKFGISKTHYYRIRRKFG